MSIWWSDLVRFGVLLPGGLLLPALVAVAWLYRRAYRAIRDAGPTPGHAGEPGLLPAHVAAMAVSYALFVALLMLGVVDSIGTPLRTWRTPAFGVACWIGLAGLIILGRLQHRRRIRLCSERTTVVVEQTVTVEPKER